MEQMTQIVVALIGSITSIIVAFIMTRKPASSENASSGTPLPQPVTGRKIPFLAILATGLSVTAIIVGLIAISSPQFMITSQKVAAHTEEYTQKFNADNAEGKKFRETHGIPLLASRLPDENVLFSNIPSLKCDRNYSPQSVWIMVTDSYSRDQITRKTDASSVMYTTKPRINADGNVEVGLRAYQGKIGYDYSVVYLLCSRVG